MKRIIGSTHSVFKDHDTGPGHPERAERMDAVLAGIRETGLDKRIEWVEPEEVDTEALFRVHAKEHVQEVLALRGKSAMVDADTIVSPASIEAALRAAGGAVSMVDSVMRGDADYGFCFSRPPGHHAERNRSMGFCLFNNVAVAAAHAIEKSGAKRVLIFDPDVHHGNGTQDIFYKRGDVLFISIHQWPFYPGTGAVEEVGAGNGTGATINIPLPGGCGNADFQYIAREVVVPALQRFEPDLVLFSAGFDAHEDDPLGNMRLTSPGFARMYAVVLEAMEAAGVPGVFCLEGGYSLEALRTAVPAVLDAVLRGCDEVKPADPGEAAVRIVEQLRRVQDAAFRGGQQ